MTAKRSICLLLLTLCCAPMGVRGQLVFDPAQWDFGSIREADGRVSHTFAGVNRSDRPVVVLDVTAACGCTVPSFSKRPVLPGDTARITVTYNPADRPGVFTKELQVYSSERQKIATLTVRGQVVPRPRSIEELYPIDAGGGLRLTATLSAFSYIYPGQTVQGTIGYANASDRTLRLDLRPEYSSGLLQLDFPRLIAPGACGTIGLAYRIEADAPRYGTVRDALDIAVDGRSNGTVLVAHGIGVDPRPAAAQPAPSLELDPAFLRFGAVDRSGPPRRLTLTLTNTGTAELIVRAVEGLEPLRSTLIPGLRIAPGHSFRADVELDPALLDYGVTTRQLLLVTNDPMHPMRRVRITAVVEQTHP